MHHVLTLDNLPENRVLAGEPLGCGDRNEELRAVGVRAGVRHRQLAGLIEAVRGASRFVFKLISGATHARTLRVSALNHEIRNHTMENGAVVKAV